MAGSAVATLTSKKGRGLVRVDVVVTCVSGAVSATAIGAFYGRLVGILTKGAGTTMTATADILLTDALTGAPIISDLTFAGGTQSEYYRPTGVVTDNAGAAISASTSANDVNRDIFVAGGLKLAIANATTTDTGTVSLLIEEAA